MPMPIHIPFSFPTFMKNSKSLSFHAITWLSWSLASASLLVHAADDQPMNPPGVVDLIQYRVHDDTGRQTPQWVPMLNTRSKWANSVYMWYLNPAYKPSQLSQSDVVATMQLATSRWAQMCNIEFRYMGLSDAQPMSTVGNDQDRINVLAWGKFINGMAGVAGYAATHIVTSGGVATIVDADLIINNEMATDINTLDGILMHELGHAIGIGHSDKQAAIMSAAPYHELTYNRTLRADDIEACTSLYGEASNQQTNRVLNWAESAYPSLLKPAAPATQGYDGFTYRYYRETGNYAASKNGRAYFMGTDGVIQDLGSLAPYVSQATKAGY
jgi:hypothetical protein